MTHRQLVLLFVLVVALALTACNGEVVDSGTASPTAATADPSPTSPAPTKDPTPSPGPALTADPTDTVGEPTDAAGPDDGDLPGEVVELFPYEGAELAVVGVEADDTLNVRSGPGVDFDVLVELAPLAEGVVATGHNRHLDDRGIWAEITAEGVTGWANTAFLTHLGLTVDVTSRLFPTPEERPQAETMRELGQVVGQRLSSEEPPSTITVVDWPTVGDLGEITVDVIGLGDDAANGVRLRVFAEPHAGGEGFTVRTVEQTAHCTRGVTDDGVCV
ncbi:MAG TPA: hypothetical protein VMM13_11695 [Euzebya sp.]|nr:hypothetical protein [Euzebya sp.]